MTTLLLSGCPQAFQCGVLFSGKVGLQGYLNLIHNMSPWCFNQDANLVGNLSFYEIQTLMQLGLWVKLISAKSQTT